MLVMVGFVLAQHPAQVGRFQIRVRSSSSRRHPPIQRSVIAFIRGVRTLHSDGPDPGTGEDRRRTQPCSSSRGRGS